MMNKTTMTQPTVTPATLEACGWDEEAIARWETAEARYLKHGYRGLTAANRRVRLSAQSAVQRAETKRLQELAAATKRRLESATPVEKKLHYRWLENDLRVLADVVETHPGEISALAIWKSECLRALVKFQPKLGRAALRLRTQFDEHEHLFLAEMAELGRVAQFDTLSYIEQTRAAFPEYWNAEWETAWFTQSVAWGAVIPDYLELDVRSYVRPLVERLTVEIFCGGSAPVAV